MAYQSKKYLYTVGTAVYNEENNIKKFITSVISQKTSPNFILKEIIIVASGCTDNTIPIVENLMRKYKIIKLISQKNREGKASAVNILLKKINTKLIILQSADTLPGKDCYKKVLVELSKPHVGMVGARIVPMDDEDTFCGYSNIFRWKLHHLINIKYPERPKVGELVAFKKLFSRIPPKTAADEASIEPLIKLQDYQVRYVPDAIVFNMGPSNLRELLSRRRSIYAGHYLEKVNYGYEVITFSTFTVIPVFLSAIPGRPKELYYALLSAFVELTARIFGYLDIKYKIRDQSIWKIAKTTKKLN